MKLPATPEWSQTIQPLHVMLVTRSPMCLQLCKYRMQAPYILPRDWLFISCFNNCWSAVEAPILNLPSEDNNAMVTTSVFVAAIGTGATLFIAVTIVVYKYYVQKRKCKEWSSLDQMPFPMPPDKAYKSYFPFSRKLAFDQFEFVCQLLVNDFGSYVVALLIVRWSECLASTSYVLYCFGVLTAVPAFIRLLQVLNVRKVLTFNTHLRAESSSFPHAALVEKILFLTLAESAFSAVDGLPKTHHFPQLLVNCFLQSIMADKCAECQSLVNRSKPGISCSGFCDQFFHISCMGIPYDVLKVIKTPGLFWFCPSCVNKRTDLDFVSTRINKKVDALISNIHESFNEAKSVLINKIDEQFDQDTLRRMPATDASYANILKKNVNLIVKPKNNDQPHAATRLKMRQSVDPVTNNIKFSQVKNIKNGGLLIKCDGSEDASKLKELASLHLADDYEVKEVRKFNPRLKIVGMSECIDKEQLSVILKSQNSVFQNDSECTVLKVWPTKKSDDVFQAILDVDIATYSSILSRGNLIVNFESCIVYDAISLRLCFKCCGHNHYAKNCKSKVQCGNVFMIWCIDVHIRYVFCLFTMERQAEGPFRGVDSRQGRTAKYSLGNHHPGCSYSGPVGAF
ncbi:unnamed protein product [Acanthoscelides obtectus]|uniref:PHD-type domain-containing protein n=1 Tax=Acanthoscelides obtectus TaxID=200917 RepID=A0A9P0P7D1_ACAOB|nr:unnamed protein product [Acanthoscelides obtectus]CAK1631189.1 hypothetical protein AOBTE_LOCUS6804 [Acanthoscelides obtectus]